MFTRIFNINVGRSNQINVNGGKNKKKKKKILVVQGKFHFDWQPKLINNENDYNLNCKQKIRFLFKKL